MFTEWKNIWGKYKNILKPNRKTGQDLLEYLSNKYFLTEIYEENALEAIYFSVTMNKPHKDKLAYGTVPVLRAFFLENKGNGYGKLRLNYALQKAKEFGYKRIRLDTTLDSIKAILLYKKFNFYEIEKYNDNIYAEVFMELRF